MVQYGLALDFTAGSRIPLQDYRAEHVRRRLRVGSLANLHDAAIRLDSEDGYATFNYALLATTKVCSALVFLLNYD